MQPTTLYLILAFLCVAVGFIVGTLVTMIFTEREKKQLLKEGGLLPEGIDQKQHTALLRLWRDENGATLVELNGRILTDIRQASTAQRLELEAATEKWLKWLGVRVEIPRPAPRTAPQPAATPAPVPPQPARIPDPVASRPAVEPVAPVISIPAARPPQPAPRASTMIEQIDEILQEMIQRSDCRQRSVKITQDFREGIVVWLDGGRYLGLDGVPDPQIQKLIRAAAAEWERRSERAK